MTSISTDEIHKYIRSALELNDRSALLSLPSRIEAQIAIDEVWKFLGKRINTQRDPRWDDHKLRQLALKIASTYSILPSSLRLMGVVRTQIDQQIQGGFADIFCGRFGNMDVAVKRLHIFLRVAEPRRAELKQAFYLECLLWKDLSHPNILPFLGVSEDMFPNTVCIILPWMVNGRVVDYAMKLRGGGRLQGQDFPKVINRWLHQVALGLQYLHTEKIVHGDIHGANILVDADGSVKLTDFGMSVAAEGTPYHYGSTHGGGAVRWTAPELMEAEEFGLQTHRPTYQSDVYSFACVCVELYSMRPPFPELLREYQIITRVMRGGRPQRPTLPDGGDISDDVWSLITSSWAHQPSDRPTVTYIIDMLEKAASSTSFVTLPLIQSNPEPEPWSPTNEAPGTDRIHPSSHLRRSPAVRGPREKAVGGSPIPALQPLIPPGRDQSNSSHSLSVNTADKDQGATLTVIDDLLSPVLDPFLLDDNDIAGSNTLMDVRPRHPGYRQSFKEALRVHNGAVDNKTITTGDPPEIMRIVREALDGMGVEIHAETGYSYHCTRRRRGTAGMRKSGDILDIAAGGSAAHGDPTPRWGKLRGLLPRRFSSESEIPTASSSQVSWSPLYGESYQDQGDEVRFSVEMTRIDRLEATYSLDIRRLKGSVGSYKFLYDTLKDQVIHTDAFMQHG